MQSDCVALLIETWLNIIPLVGGGGGGGWKGGGGGGNGRVSPKPFAT